jgi:hypothetical protein
MEKTPRIWAGPISMVGLSEGIKLEQMIDCFTAPGGTQLQRFAQSFKEEVKDQFWGAKKK